MNKVITITLSIIGTIAIICAIALFLWGTPKTTTQMYPPFSGTSTLPSGSTRSNQSHTGTTTAPTFTLAGKSGPISVADFLHNGTTEPDPENLGMYFIAGNAGYCTGSGVCPGGASSTDFYIVYDSKLQLFTITLLKEPIGKMRSEAEQFMLKLLSIPQGQLCLVNYYLGTVNGLNDFYAGTNLGFSFCPGATPLP